MSHRIHTLLIALTLLACCTTVQARDTRLMLDFASALEQGWEEGILDRDIAFILAGNAHDEPVTVHAESRSNRKTNAFGKSDEKACNWALLSALKALQQRVVEHGGNAVINIRSNYRDKITEDAERFECGAGAMVAGVALIGDIVTLP